MPPTVRQATGQPTAQPTTAQPPIAQRPPQPTPTETRVDAAHALANGRAEARSADPYRAAVDTAYGLIDEGGLIEGLGPLRSQAEQLGVYLDQRQRQLDRRQAELDRKQADFDSEVREARIWFTERREELTQQEERLAEAERQLDLRTERLTAAEATADRERQKADAALRRLECDLQRREAELQARLARAEQQATALSAAQEDFQRRRDEHDVYLGSLRQQIDARREASLSVVRLALAGVERRRAAVEGQLSRLISENATVCRSPTEDVSRKRPLGPQATAAVEAVSRETALPELARSRQETVAESERQGRRLKFDRRRFAERRRRWRTRREAQQKMLAEYSQELDRRRSLVEDTYTQASQMHREALELRLATEELQAQLAGSVGPALLGASLGQLRLRLAGHYQQEAAHLQHRRAELESLKLELGRIVGVRQ